MGNVYMEADQVRFKDSTYRNVQEGLAAALEGGGGGGTTVVANPEGSATADLAKLKVGDTIYGIPETAAKVTYDNTSSGLTADDVQEAIDELNTGLSGVTELIPSGATSSNKLATASDIPDAVTGNPSGSATAGDLTKLQIGSNIYNVPSGGYGLVYSTTEHKVGTWMGADLYAKSFTSEQISLATDKLYTQVNNMNISTDNIMFVETGVLKYTHSGGQRKMSSYPCRYDTDDTAGTVLYVYIAPYMTVDNTHWAIGKTMTVTVYYTKS